MIRSVALQIREMEYVTSARAIGAKDLRIMFRHVAPQCVAPYLILATAHLGVAILIESSLGFLGAGVPPPTATWGNTARIRQLLVVQANVVDGVLSRTRHHHHRAGVQPVRRLTARRA